MYTELEKCGACGTELKANSEEMYWHLMIHKASQGPQLSELDRRMLENMKLYQSAPIGFHHHGSQPCYTNPCFWC